MGKKKKDKKKDVDVNEIKKEYEESLEMLKAKHEQLGGMIREIKIYLNELKELRDKMSPVKDIEEI